MKRENVSLTIVWLLLPAIIYITCYNAATERYLWLTPWLALDIVMLTIGGLLMLWRHISRNTRANPMIRAPDFAHRNYHEREFEFVPGEPATFHISKADLADLDKVARNPVFNWEPMTSAERAAGLKKLWARIDAEGPLEGTPEFWNLPGTRCFWHMIEAEQAALNVDAGDFWWHLDRGLDPVGKFVWSSDHEIEDMNKKLFGSTAGPSARINFGSTSI